MAHQEDDTLLSAKQDSPPNGTAASDLEQLFREHHSRIYGAAYRITRSAHDAEDVLQTVFMRLLGRENLDLAPHPSSYLYRAAINAALDLLRSRARKPSTSLDHVELPAGPGEDPAEHHRGREIQRCLQQALTSLTPENAQLFALRFFEGYGNSDIARMLQVAQGTIGVRLHRIRGRIKNEMTPCLGGSDHV